MPIRVYNEFLDLLGETDSYQSLQYERNYHGVGTFELHINRYMHGADNFQKGNIIALNKQENKAGIILTREIDLDESGKQSENFKLTGLTMDGIMNRRISIPPSSTSHDRKSGDAETVMKHYVYNNFIDPAAKSRKLDILEIAPNQNRGEHVVWESRFKDIGKELEKISIESGLGWGIFVNFNTKKLVFDCFQAKNLTQNNEFGYSPVFFSPEFETIKSQNFIDSDADYKNVGYVGGQGEGVGRKIIELGNAAGWDRIETFVDARDIGTEDEETAEELTDEEIEEMLIKRGNEKLSEMETVFSLEAEILTPITRKSYEYTHEGYLHPAQTTGRYEAKQQQITPFQYEKDFDLGDRVQIVNKSWELTMTAPIINFMEVHEPGGFRLEGTFGQTRPTLITKIKDKFDELEGIEKQEAPAAVAVEYMKKAMKYGDDNLTKEERKRIEQAIANLEASKSFTEQYAEKAIHKGTTPPDDKTQLWIDTSGESDVWKRWDETKEKWVEGPSGPEGVPGPPGNDGQTLYTWVRYADSPTSGMSNLPDNKKYIGLAYNKKSPVESDDYDDYEWAKIEGEQGMPGAQGSDGKPTFTWIRYADDIKGNGMSDSPDDKRYLGLAYNKDTSKESDDPNDYSWSPLYDNVIVGGRNYVQNSLPQDTSLWKFTKASTGARGSISKGEIVIGNDDSGWAQWQIYSNQGATALDDIEGDETFTLSFEAKQLSDSLSEYPFAQLRYVSNNIIRVEGDVNKLSSGKWVKFSNSTKVPQEVIDSSAYSRIILQFNGEGSVAFRKIKLEKGNVASDHSIAPEDIEKDAKDKADKAEKESKDHADKQDEKVKEDAAKDAKEKADKAEKNANDFSKNADNLMEGIINVGSVPIQTAYSGARIEFDGTNGFVQYDKDGNPVAWFDLKGNAKFSGDITGATGTFGDVNVKDGDFTLEDNTSNVKYSVTPARNMIQDHSFEMMQPGYTGADSIEHNWVDIDKTVDDKWSVTGNPKIVTQFAPEDAKALAIHGNRAIAVKDANFVRQYIYEGVGGGAKFTISGFFKRQWNQPPGKPRFEVDVIDASGGRTRLINEIFETVPTDYSVVRRSATFTVPSNFEIGGSLDVKLSGGDSNWVHCDGIQMVEGDNPTVYQPEDSIWEVAKDNYKVRGEHRVLWADGAVYLLASHTLYPEKPLQYCKNGWILEWSNYNPGVGATDTDWQYTYVAKNTSVDATSSNGARVYLRSGNTNEVLKYFIIRGGGDRITGHDNNGKLMNGNDNRNMALRTIYEW
ncbi:siphovirus ReqiPepy6 Gp37-like family protein [Virgibacillus halotolerans]|uniref:siphovirus ReqiPepy6 Gp37-like family protein n=1 Tax=Virgibacillus halotolerans TaxID=1071053 RepID=UPI001EF93F3F|nr:siphovirus ReqiPepy6 Gp37-like family protein [Virgibacillus halotolerans]